MVVAISDTGTGIGEDIRDHIFEPFMTTKPLGHGMELVLSQFYGFARRSGGDVEVDTVTDKGTAIRLIIPRDGAD